MPIEESKVFISYSRNDADFALKLGKDLRARGINIWVDKLDIKPGEIWDNAVEKAMKEHVKAASVPQYRRLLMIKDTDFHLKLIECAGNKVIYTVSRWILEQIYLKYRPEYMREARLKEAAEEHRMLFKALKERNAEKTTRLLKQHIRNGSEHIVGSLWQDKNIEL